jgi:hypothetical protein
MFRPFDLVAPIGFTLVALVFGIWGAIVGQDTPAKIISMLPALAGLVATAGLYFMRWHARRADFVTSQGMRVRLGRQNRPTKVQVERWLEWVIEFWSDHYPPRAVADAFDGFFMVFVDKEKLSAAGRFMRGYTTATASVIGYNGNPAYTESLAKHEPSHHVLDVMGIPWNEEIHHAIFLEKALGH